MLMLLNPLVTHINRYDYRKSGSFAYAHIHLIKDSLTTCVTVN